MVSLGADRQYFLSYKFARFPVLRVYNTNGCLIWRESSANRCQVSETDPERDLNPGPLTKKGQLPI